MGYFHGADLGRHGGTDPARHHHAGKHGPEFAKHRQGHHRANRCFHVQHIELKKCLSRENRPGERPRNDHHQLRAKANFCDLLDNESRADSSGTDRKKGLPGQCRNLPEKDKELGKDADSEFGDGHG